MQVPVLKKIVINQGLGMATADKKIIDIAISELSTITGQKAVATVSKKDISNFKLRKNLVVCFFNNILHVLVYTIIAFISFQKKGKMVK